MAKTDFKSVDQYISMFPKEVAENLEKIRQTIKQAVPEAEEVISYQMPAFKYHGFLAYFGAFTNHYSLFMPSSLGAHEAFKKELEPYKQAKGTLQFQKSELIPFALIAKLVKHGADYNVSRSLKKEKK